MYVCVCVSACATTRFDTPATMYNHANLMYTSATYARPPNARPHACAGNNDENMEWQSNGKHCQHARTKHAKARHSCVYMHSAYTHTRTHEQTQMPANTSAHTCDTYSADANKPTQYTHWGMQRARKVQPRIALNTRTRARTRARTRKPVP